MNLLDWKVKAVLVVVAISLLYMFHIFKVKEAVSKQENEITLEQQRQTIELQNETFWSTQQLKDSFKVIQKEKDAKIASVNNRYRDLQQWVRNQNSNPGSDTRDTGNTESTGSTYFGGLYTKDAIDLAEYAKSTEELKVHLLACYASYDEVKNKLGEFRRKHTDKTD